MRSFWTAEQDATLLRLWPERTAEEIAAEIGTTRSAVLGRHFRLRGGGAEYERKRKAREKIERAERAARRQGGKLKSQNETLTFVDDTAKKTGKGRSTVRR